ncbi:MAG: DNA polymerase I, partial [Bacteroidales bacterium]|nr:DNA polymerase I [Bacteroidales bacterium]
IFFLDAYALIFRSYYAFINRPIKNSKGQNTSAIFGFVNSLEEIIQKEKPSHIAVVFDPPGPNFRKEMYPEYKANRSETPEDIILSVPYIKKIIDAYNIPVIEVPGFEADDVIGTMAKTAAHEGYEVYMMTPDKDYGQLVEENIFMYKPRRSGDEAEIMGVEEILDKYSIERPEQVIDILALAGDASDNVPGAPGIGEKTAIKLLKQYGSVEGLLENTDKLKGKQKENVENNKEQIELSKVLVTIKTDVDVDFEPEKLQLSEKNKPELKSLFTELEFRTIAKRIIGEELNAQPTQGSLFDSPIAQSDTQENENFNSFDQSSVTYSLIKSANELEDLLNKIGDSKFVCLDTETTGLDVFEARLLGIAISAKEKEAFYVDMVSEFEEKKEMFIEHFSKSDCTIIGHNLKYDLQILINHGIELSNSIFDTMVAHYLLNPNAKHKLDIVAEELLNYKMIPITDLIGPKGKSQKTMENIAIEKVTDYACEDADITFQLFNVLKKKIDDQELHDLLYDIELPLVTVLTDVELAGFKLNSDSLNEYSKVIEKEIVEMQSKIYEHAGQEFNIASPRQLGEILFEKLKISSNVSRTKTKQYSTSEETLVKLKEKHPIIDLILEYRSLTKLQSTYITALPKLVKETTGKIHTTFRQTVAATGRLSSDNPNLQNIPIREERGREIRKSFIPSSADNTLIAADYSQIELRIMAHLSEDKNMIEAFFQGMDIHQSTAAKIFKISNEEVTRDMRSKAKTANFGIIYGISAFGLAQRLNISRTDAKQLIDSYFDTFPGVKQYMESCIEKTKEKGYVTTLFGRKRMLPEIHSANANVRGFAERNAINTPIQGTAADIIKLAMIKIQQQLIDKGLKSKMILQVHDELIFDVPSAEIDIMKELVKTEMEAVIKMKVPLLVEVGTGNNWLEAH